MNTEILDRKLQGLESRYEELNAEMAKPETAADPALLQRYGREYASLTDVVQSYRALQDVRKQIADTEQMLGDGLDEEMRALAYDELGQLREREQALYRELQIALLPKDIMDERDAIVTIQAGAGGDEAGLFAADLYRMYTRYAESRRWRVEMMSSNPTGLGGYKEIIMSIEGQGAYSRLKYEGGVHRVQRVPVTEGSGRIHTSAVTVAVLPEADEVEIAIDPKDLRIDVFRSSGPGGQSVNTTDSAVRITHIPTGIVISCQDEKSQHKNRAKGMKILRARLLEKKQEEQRSEIAATRKSMVGTGDRSERIRTYNFPQGRLTDHRINFTLYKLDRVMEGELDEVIDALITHYQAEALKATAKPQAHGSSEADRV